MHRMNRLLSSILDMMGSVGSASNPRLQLSDNQNKALKGQESVEPTLSTKTISFKFCKLSELLPKYSQVFANELRIPIGVVRADIKRVIDNLQENLHCCVEYPYVDEYYRDTYYSYYSRKHFAYSRYCFRISFFSNRVTEDNYFSISDDGDYFGYMVLRPTPRRIIGYTFLSPKIYKNNDFSICQCEHLTSVMGKRQVTNAFPFCGQDGEMNLCSETSIVMLFDYFSRRYNKYSRQLPSNVVALHNENLANKLQPSRGLDVGTANSLICSMGMTTRRIDLATKDFPADNDIVFDRDDFYNLLHIYIDSGFPIYASTANHSFLIIGRENALFCQGPNLITVSDNEYPYFKWDEKEQNEIESFIVPIPENVLLDANKINVKEIYDDFCHDSNTPYILKEGVQYYNRIFLTTSRAFKQYIVSSKISNESKKTIVSIAMPKFVWICETLKTNDTKKDISKIPVVSTMLLDATVYPMANNHLLMVKTQETLIIPDEDNIGKTEKNYIKKEYQEILFPFNNNLKGKHNGWNE